MSDEPEVRLGMIDPALIPTADVFHAEGENVECCGWTFEVGGAGFSMVWACPECGLVHEALAQRMPDV